jgi:hypothetical protein
MPPLPDHFVERPDHQQAVKDRLLSEDPKVFGTLVVSAIHGLGGIGKSVLAAKLAHDDAGAGSLWRRHSLGHPGAKPRSAAVAQRLDSGPGGQRLQAHRHRRRLSAHLRTLLYAKRVLLVVDDIWHPDHLEPFRVGGSGCCVLVTTREARIPEAHSLCPGGDEPRASLWSLMTQKLSEPLN